MIWTPQNTASFPRTTRIIDVNHDNPITDESMTGAGIIGGIVKVTEGVSFIDPMAAHNLDLLARTNRLRGAYHFTEPGSGSAQARFFWANLLRALHGPCNLSINITLDLERGRYGLMTIADAGDFVKFIHDEKTGTWPLVYGGGGLLRDAFEGNPGKYKNSPLLKCGLFLADPRANWRVITGWERFLLRQSAQDVSNPGWDYDQYLAEPGADPVAELKARWPLMLT